MLTPGLTDGKTRTLDGGYSIAARLAGDSMHQATNLIAAVYGDRVTNIAPMNDRLELEVMKTDLRIGIVKEEIRDERNTCGAISSVPANLSLMEASSGLEYPARSNPCGCGVMTTYSDQFSDWAKDRYQKAAIREVDAVIAGKTLETVIVAGGGHAYHAIKRMREKGIGYQVIMPAGATESLMDIEHDPVETETQKIKKYLACSPKHSKRIPAFDAMVEKKTEQTMIIVRQQFGAIQKK